MTLDLSIEICYTKMVNENDTAKDRDRLDAAAGVHRLLDILTQEVSLVNRAANQRKWLVRKGFDMEIFENADGTLSTDGAENSETSESVEKNLKLMKAVKTALDGVLATTTNGIADLVKAVKEAKEGDGEGLPKSIASEITALVTALRGVASKYVAKGEESEEIKKWQNGEDESTAKARRLLWAALERVDRGELASADYKASVDQIVASLRSMVAKEELEKQMMIPGPVKEKAVAVLEEVTNKLASLVASVRGAEETNEQMATPLPREVADAIADVSTLLEGLVAGYPSPKSKSEDEAEAQDGGDKQENTSDEMATEKGLSPFKTLQEARAIIDAIVAKVNPGQSLDEDSYQKLDKLRVLLAATGGKSESEEKVEKAGAKMSRDRRKKFEEAVKTLISLFKEIMPESELGKMPHLVTKSAIDEEKEDLKVQLKKASDDIIVLRSEIADLKTRPASSGLAPVDGASGNNEERIIVHWPMDLNA